MATDVRRPALGLVGLGNMGLPMARRLLETGWDLTVLDQRPDAVSAAVEAGAAAVDSLADLADACEVISIMVWNDAQVLDVAVGDSALVEACTSEQLLLVHSSVAPSTVRRVGEAAARRGVRVVDAPVSGGAAGRVETGELTIMAGGEAEDVQRALPVFDSMARRVFHVGPLGSGVAAKIANNTMSIGNLLFVAEALRFAEAEGVPPATVLEIAAESSGQSYAAENFTGALRTMRAKRAGGNDAPHEALGKDLFLTVTTAREHLVHLPLTALASALATHVMGECEEIAEGLLRET